jgi:hypothetical protein
VTPAKRGRGGQPDTKENPQEPTTAERRASMTWAQRLKRVFGIDIETCPACGGAVRIIACIEDPAVIGRILTHLDAQASAPPAAIRPSASGSTDRNEPTTMICGCDARGAARVLAGRRGDVTPKNAPAHRSSAWILAEPCDLGAVCRSERGGLPLTTHARNGSHRPKRPEKAVYTSYTRPRRSWRILISVRDGRCRTDFTSGKWTRSRARF